MKTFPQVGTSSRKYMVLLILALMVGLGIVVRLDSTLMEHQEVSTPGETFTPR